MTNVMDRPIRRSAHGQAVVAAIPEVVSRLRTVLGRDVVAVLTARTPRAVTRWVAGDAEPPAREEDLLRDAFQIAQVLSEVEPDEVIRAWFMGMNPQLGDESPVEALREGRVRDAMAAARAFVNAG
ncbi:hypothetical protein [Microbacterium murale]|uniref:XRE family transcriptional regulator n=1 Tax=Microbacterium murale TaxID=1081040 RepID=A0ABQ1RR86_9MICO|nr:hypothetical protein [Microbacterium murale]GGD76763.1 hypothetical protein GCM10007269_19640 [Microbacterium murale]